MKHEISTDAAAKAAATVAIIIKTMEKTLKGRSDFFIQKQMLLMPELLLKPQLPPLFLNGRNSGSSSQ